MTAASLLAQLRSEGVSVRLESDRLIVDAPAGSVTDELRAQLRERKAELIAALEGEHVRLDESSLIEVRRKIADLLAIAFQRYTAVERAGEHGKTSGNDELANSSRPSVHGVVP